MTNTTRDLKALAARINKKLGKDVLIQGSAIRNQTFPRISTGILSLDDALGGGWPLNTWCEIVGEESSGKTATVLKTIAHNQKNDPDFVALWIAAEEFVPEYAEAIGVDLNRMIIADTNEQEFVFQLIIDCLDDRAADMVVIDSLPQLVPDAERAKEMNEALVGLGARLTGKFFRKVGNAQKRSLVDEDRYALGIVINQYREKIGVMYGDNRTTPGGKAKNFAYHIRVEVRRDEWIMNEEKGADKARIGQSMKYRVSKNKTATPHKTAYTDYYFANYANHHVGEFDVIKDIFSMAMVTDVVQRKGAYFIYGDAKFQGRSAFVDAMADDNEMREMIAKEVTERIEAKKKGVVPAVKEDSSDD